MVRICGMMVIAGPASMDLPQLVAPRNAALCAMNKANGSA